MPNKPVIVVSKAQILLQFFYAYRGKLSFIDCIFS